MGYIKAERAYKCYEDCEPYCPCPGHSIAVEFFSASPTYRITQDGRSICFLCPNMMNALIDAIIELGEKRSDVIQIRRVM